jgi:hypothetical protein
MNLSVAIAIAARSSIDNQDIHQHNLAQATLHSPILLIASH